MSDRQLPAWSRGSTVMRLPGTARVPEMSPAWAWGGASGEGVRVAVIDSGIDADHPALESCVDVDAGVAFGLDGEGKAVAELGPHGDLFGHGTACASIIHLIAPAARLTSVRVLGVNNTAKATQFIAGLEWAIAEQFDVINLSLGTRSRDWALALHELCDKAYFQGSVVVTAANNLSTPSFPSLYASVFSVACNLSRDPFRFHANPTPPTEFLARGIDVEVAWLGGGTTVATGNSFAAPHIAGLAALIRSKHPELRPFHVKAALWATSANVQEATEPEFGGRLTQAVNRTRWTRAVTQHRPRSLGATDVPKEGNAP